MSNSIMLHEIYISPVRFQNAASNTNWKILMFAASDSSRYVRGDADLNSDH